MTGVKNIKYNNVVPMHMQSDEAFGIPSIVKAESKWLTVPRLKGEVIVWQKKEKIKMVMCSVEENA